MSENVALSGEIPPACDLCHSRKIKCDRRSPCANCADAGAQCQRLRPGRSSKKRSLPSDSAPEFTVLEFNRSSRPRQMRPGGVDQVLRGLSPATTPNSTTDADDSNYHAIQAKDIIQLELDDSRYISRERQIILRSALQLVNEIAEKERPQSGTFMEDGSPEAPTIPIPEVPPRELLFMLLRGPSELLRSQWPHHISDTACEKMATALLQGDLEPHEQLFHQYCICIYVKGIIHLNHVSRISDNVAIKNQLSQSTSAYTAAALRSIGNFNILNRPNLTTIQCLISSALLMQFVGRLNQCWVLISYAARQITSLNYHKIRRTPTSTSEEQDICMAVYWCYYLDRTLSALFGRPPSLPDLQVSPSDLIPLDSSSLYDTMIRVVLDLAQIQGELHDISNCGNRESKSAILETCRDLESRMSDMLPILQTNLHRHRPPAKIWYDWHAVDFCFNAIFVEILRTRLKSSFSPLVHKITLLYAENSLKAFLLLLERPEEASGSEFDDPYPSFLTWTLFIYPLSPFFVVFCNIIGTLNHDGYVCMQRIIDKLSGFKQYPHLERLLNLLRSLQRLCDPLFQEQAKNQLASEYSFNVGGPSGLAATNDHATVPDTSANRSVTDQWGNDTMLQNEPTGSNIENGPSADWLMWELFNSQVPAGWVNSDFDPFIAE
ncbi:hypothetical protein ASPSYDRAFT_75230 [Aspergillus sydowii CBS 593.65]|uniref:Zn(2)-C6 fungal-type domain-containing protein n=1 Tax=Aspergillus sydowii CBS 593.65 TaxID=1036612 RepID=A0A1L9TZ18_9EURO|nr:uncharacterized protein ASPSYDRAFT_75230 [Aspergillus sydowii CBS 593.65]OJJ64671.1 hypothetical protein ASPSYDRAFT_75230 [Aspergillus sydowii CBS 593.65]